ncbi:ABC transporter permease [Altererythrobacter sp. TH136]|uniref:ABC transporter permease n=1 Tax=Altererythrobacter sp. TH136 TaxID=2067415 RepID=UPI0011645AA9|nr:ABC transporter permease [Altererythrobacter sp. TH136]QDM41045.1 ABC transporter permease [Altererythrobacter sp. TH136]
MIRNILLVAGREFHQVVQLKSFWLTLLLIPAALALGPILGERLEDRDPMKVMMIDRAGGTARTALEQRFAVEHDREVLAALSRYVRRHGLEKADPQAPWAAHDRWYTPVDVAAFRAAGGVDAAIASIDRVKAEDTPAFEADPPRYAFVAPPASLAAAQGPQLQAAVDRALEADDSTTDHADLVVLVGSQYPADPTVRLWANERPDTDFVTSLQDTLTADLRQRLLTDGGMSAQAAAAVQAAAPAIAVTTPPPGGGGKEAMLVRSIVPLALAYILMMGLMLSGSWMLQGSIEERSKKLLESILACITPEELMYGKLLGALAIGLSMLAVWLGTGAVVAFATHGAIADLIRPALAPVTSPGAIATLIFFFIAGYIAISIVFVAIGAMADTMSEAQGFLMPVLLAILLPVTFLMQAIIAGNSGPMVQVLTWVPIWTPFAVLARLGMGIPTAELIGAGVVLTAFIALEVIFLGRLFRASLLAQGQKPGLKMLMERLRPTTE